MGIAQIASRDLGEHIVAIKGGTAMYRGAGSEDHVGDYRIGIPAQRHVFDGLMLGMADVDFDHGIGRQGVVAELFPDLEDEGQQIKSTSFTGRLPPQGFCYPSQLPVHGIPEYATIALLIAGIANELMIPDPDFRQFGMPCTKYSDGGLDIATPSRISEMLYEGFKDIIGLVEVAGIVYFECFP